MHTYFVYILTNRPRGVLYVGMTSDIGRRLHEHEAGVFEGFTKRYNVKRIVYCEQFEWVLDAQYRERQLKKWNRAWKIELIEKANPDWVDIKHLLH